MHEVDMTKALIATLKNWDKEQPENHHIEKVHLIVGKFTCVEPASLQFAFINYTKNTFLEIQFVPLETGKAAAAFVAGQVDGVAVFAPFTTQALKRPQSRELFSSKDFPGAISDHLVVSRTFLETYPEKVQGMVDSWFATLDYIKKNPEKAYEIMAKRAGVSVAEYREYAEGTRLFTVEENLQAFKDGNDMTSLKFAAEKMSQFLQDVGLAAAKPDLSQIFDDQFVKAYAAKVKGS